MLCTSLILHANLQYAEIPTAEIPKVVRESYIPVLKGLLSIPSSRTTLNFTGVTLEILNESYPEVIETVKQGIATNQFEILGCAYSHPVLPLIPTTDVKLQISTHLDLLKKTLAVKKPRGFWLPEAAWSPSLAPVLRNFSFEWVMIDYDHLVLSKTKAGETASLQKRPATLTERGIGFLTSSLLRKTISLPSLYLKFRHDINDYNFEPVVIQGAGETIAGIVVKRVWSPLYFGFCLSAPWLLGRARLKKKIRKMTQSKKVRGLFIPFASDLEILGHRGFLPITIPVENFLDFVRWVVAEKDITLLTPSAYLRKNSPQETVYLRTGSWAPDHSLKIWSEDPDDRMLNALCDEARLFLLQAVDSEKVQEGWRELMLAENSDGRGWNPLPERRLACFGHALRAIEVGRIYAKIS